MCKQSLLLNSRSNRPTGFLKGVLVTAVFGVVLLFFASAAFGQATRTWLGTEDRNWNNPNNWAGGLPVAGDHVIINTDQVTPITNHPTISLASLSVSGNVNLQGITGENHLITVTGNLSVAAGKTLSLGSPGTGGTDFTLAAGATGTLDGTLFLNSGAAPNPIVTVDGNLAISASGLISGQAGSRFTLSAGATLQIADPAGITISSATGAVRVPGTRTYSADANYVYNGTAPQFTGNGLPNYALSLSIDNSTGATLSFTTPVRSLFINEGAISGINPTRFLRSVDITMVSGSTASSITGPGTLSVNGILTVIANGAGTTGSIISSTATLAVGRRNITVADGTAEADLTISGVVDGTGSIDKLGPGTMLLSGENTYSGTTTITEGTLRLGANEVLPNSSNVTLAGGTLSTGTSTGFNETAGTLALSANSTIALGTGNHSLNFAPSNGQGWTAGRTLTITGWTGAGGLSGTAGKIFFGTTNAGLTAPQLAQITFAGYAPGAMLLPTGELVPAYPFRSQIISAELGASTWCPGEERTISVTIRNTGVAPWTDGSGGTPVINIGVKWNTNGSSWDDYYVKVPANNLAPGGQATYTFPLFNASDNSGGTYGDPLAAGTNNITIDVIHEGVGAFSSSGLAPGNVAFTSAAITISPIPTADAGDSLADICQGQTSAPMGGSVAGGTTTGIWSGGDGEWTNANNPATATYTAAAGESGSITLTLTTTGGSCGTAIATKTITVNEVPTVEAGNALTAICQGETSTALGGIFGGGATGAVWTSTGSGTFTNNTGSTPGTATYIAGSSDSGTITLTLTSTGGSCGIASAEKTLTVNELPTVDEGPAIAAICPGEPSTALGGAFGGGATGAIWSSDGSGTFTNNTGSTPGTATYIAGATDNGIINLTLTSIGGSCGTTSSTKTITVNDVPTVNSGEAVAAICQEGTSSVLGGSFGGTATAAIWSSNGTGTFTNNDGLTPETATYTASATDSGTITLTLTSIGGPCGSVTATKTITVNPTPVANAGLAILELCQGQQSAPMGGSVGSGLSGTWSGGAGTWINANNPATARYTAGASESGPVILTLTTSGGSCGTTTATKTININPNPTASAGAMLAPICQGGTSAAMGGSVGGGATGGIWSGGAGIWTNPTDPALATYTAGSSESGTIILRLTTIGGSCGEIFRTKTITVNPTPTFTSPLTQTRCTDVPTTYTATTSTSGTSFSWTRAAVSGISNSAASGSSATATETLINTTTEPIDVTYVYTLTSNGCSFTKNVVVTVNSATVITANPDPTDYEVCFGDGFSDISVSASGTDLTYQWYSNTEADTVSGTPVNGEVSATFRPSSTPVGIQYYYVKVRGACGTLVSELSGKYEVKPTDTYFINNLEATESQTICYGEEFTELSVLADGIEPLTYQWYSSTSPAQNTNGTAIPGATFANFTPQPPAGPITTAVTTYYYVMASSGCGTIRSVKTGAFRVNPTAQINDILHAVCNTGAFTVTPANNTNGVVPTGTTYTWSAPSVEEGITGGISGSGNSITGSLSNSSSEPLTATYTVTPVTGTCSGDDFTLTVTVNPTPELSSILTPAPICSSTAFTYTPGSETSGAGFTWTRAAMSGISNAAVTTPQTTNPNETLVNTTANPINVVYRYTITANGCSNTQDVTVAVNPTPELSSTLTPPSICTNTLFTYTPASLTSGVTFTWTRAAVEGIDNAAVTTPQAADPNETLLNTTAQPIDVVYEFTLEANGCSNTQNVTVRVNPTPELSSTLTPLAICTNTAFNYTPTSNTGGAAFTWTRAEVTGISNAAVTTPQTGSINETLINTTSSPLDVVYRYTITANGCSNTQDVTVRVNPTPVLSTTLTPPEICSNTEAFTYTPGSLSTGVAFTWTRAAVSGISNAAVTSPQTANPNEILINTTANPVNVVYAYTLTANGCTNTQNVTVTVNPRPNITPSPIPVVICSGETFSVAPVNGTNGIVPSGVTYTWSAPTVNGGTLTGGDTGSGTSISGTLTHSATSDIVATYTVTPTAGGCSGMPFTVAVTVKPTVTLDIIPNQSICNGESAAAVNFTGNFSSVSWTNDNPAIGLPAFGTGNIPAFTVVNTGATPVEANITVTPIANGCSDGEPRTFKIIASAAPTITLGADYCVVPGFVQLQAASNIEGTTFSWNTSPVQTGATVNVDVAGTYIVTATTPVGCQTTASISVAQELVVNGSFTDGNVGFYSGNIYVADVPGNQELEPEGRYAVGANARDYHRYFRGIDHTNNTVGPRNFMMVNTRFSDTTVWQQTVNVEANTDYYFSAWAMTINPATQYPYAKLQFGIFVDDEEDIELVGTVLELDRGPGNDDQTIANNYWERFYGIWSSESYSGPITIRIVNLEPSLTGNDFGLDDISFGTLSTFIELTSAVGTDDQTVCANTPITDISYSAGSGVDGPDVDGLPDGLEYTWNGVTLRISGTPTESGTHTYTITTTGACTPVSKTGTITVLESPEAGEIAGSQTICYGGDPDPFTSVSPGETGPGISYLWESNTNLTTPDWTLVPSESGPTYDVPAGLTVTTQYRRITLATRGSLICESVEETSVPVTVTVQSIPTAGVIAAPPAICNEEIPGTITSTTAGSGDGAISYRWEYNTNLVTPNWQAIPGESGPTYAPSTGLTADTQYRRFTVSTLNGRVCESVDSSPVTISVNPEPTAGTIAGTQTVCYGDAPAAFTSTTDGTGTGTISYLWESSTSTPDVWTLIEGAESATYAPSGLTETTRFRRTTLATSGTLVCESEPTAFIEVIVQPVPTAGAIGGAQTICGIEDPVGFTSTADGTGDGTISYRWESSVSPFTSWTPIDDAESATYDAPGGLTETTLFRRITVSTLDGVSCPSPPTLPVEITVTPDNTVTPASTVPPLCVGTVLSPVTHTTTGATGIVPEGGGVDHNLPNGVTASWNANVITISGTPTESGVFDYSIPLAGGCGAVSATGTITVTDPSYPISSIIVDNPAVGDPTPATSKFTVYSAELTPGEYTVVYSTSGVNEGPVRTMTVNVTTPGQFTFTSLPYTLQGTTLLTILSIQKNGDLCAYIPPYQNTALYGIGCSEAFVTDDTFYVPANVYEVTIQVFGDGMGGNTATRTIPVWPSGVIYAVFDANGNVFATEVPPSEPMTERLAKAIVSTTGSNGRIVFNFDCNPLPPCATILDNGNQYTDSEGFTILRFDQAGTCTWQAPDGLTEFEILVVGGGGGGGFGSAAGGGGGGAVEYRHYTNIQTGTVLGLQDATFNIHVGSPGSGGTEEVQGGNGMLSSFGGDSFDYDGGTAFTPISAAGGGGGGSTSATESVRQGADGASGGGGAAFGTSSSNGGSSQGPSQGNDGGNGNGPSLGSAGGGGGGAGGPGDNGNNTGITSMNGGQGGIGTASAVSGTSIVYGAGGGGTSTGAALNLAGSGGSPYTANGKDYFAGGSGTNNGLGQPATTYGSGGGAGGTGGSPGFPGVVYIRYPNYRILSVEYLYFDAEYNPHLRSGDLTWASSKEWENDRFEVERSVNTARDWETIGEVKGAGYSTEPTEYSFRDLKLPLAGGNIFYRLKQVDFDGDSSYSETRAIRVPKMLGTSYWKVYPNPTTGSSIYLELLDSGVYQDELVTVRIIAATGQFEAIQSKAGASLNALVSESLRTKAAGIYIFEINWGIYREYHKVILRR